MAIKRRLIKKKVKKSKRGRKKGGFLPLLGLLGPILAGIGGLAGGAAGIASAVKKSQNDAKTLEELVRHNKKIEGSGAKRKSKPTVKRKKKISRGKGLFLKPAKA